ncbi:Methyl-coenzyme M reductase subunit alpha [uncultured archaeon]|nr:Methyl-coenzyme M reductase subunit alpha [uncultured archaeon]
MVHHHLERHKMPIFTKAMETKYVKEWGTNKVGSIAKNKITDKKTKYLRLGYTQNPRKVEMAKCGAATTKKRGPINPSK